MSAISTYLEYIRSKIYAKDVRTAIVNAISQCYDDVNKPALQTDAMQAAVQAKIDSGEMAALTIGDGTITGAKLANGTIPKAKLDPSITFDADAELDTTSTNAIQNKVVASELATVKADLGDLGSGVLNIDKVVNWQYGWINTSGVIISSTASQFALVPMEAGETIIIGTRNSNITIIGSTTADSVAVGDTVTVIQKTTSSNVFDTYTYTCAEAINLVICVRTSEYTLDFKKIAPFMRQKQDVLTCDDTPTKGSVNPVKSDGIYNAINKYFHISPNIANPADFVVGEYVNQVTGEFVKLATQTRTGYIPVVGGQNYCIANNTGAGGLYIRYMFYKSDKTYISGSGAYALLSDIDFIVTTPANAAYLVMSGTGTNFPFMIAPSNTKIDFEEYGNAHLKAEYASKEESATILNIPTTIYALAGFELNIYFENITIDWEKYDWNVNCSVGKQLERGYQIVPTTSDVGAKPMTITVTDEYGNVTTVGTSLVVTSATAGSGQSKSVIILGDSTTNNGDVIKKLNENFTNDVMSVSTLGTRGTAPNNHEGRSGWTLTDYFTRAYIDYTDGRGHVENPFYNPSSQTFDAAYYFANSGIAIPDFFIINMGINDMFGYTSDSALVSQIANCIGMLNTMIASIRSVSADIKICICVTIPPNHSQDAFGKAYACGQTRNRYKRNNALWAAEIISQFDTNADVYIIPIHTNLDTVYNMGMETLPVNARNTNITYQSPVLNGGVHPATSGYWQIADVYTAFLKANA